MVTGNEVKAAIKILNNYCLGHKCTECLLDHNPPVDVYKEMENE